MKKILIIIFVIFIQTLSIADDVYDYEIEGMSIGDSLLEYLSKDYINENLEAGLIYPGSKRFSIIPFFAENSKLYSQFNIGIKVGDPKFIIHTINAFVDKEFDECIKIKKKINEEIRNIIPNSKIRTYVDKYAGNFGNSKAYVDHFYLENGMIRTWCDVWDESLENNWTNSLNVSAGSTEWHDFLRYEAYN